MVGSSREERRVVAAGKHRCLGLWIAMAVTACLFSFPTAANAQTLDDLLKTHVPKLREVERYQLNIAQKYFAEKKWKVAMAEYEKYLTLYEASDAAAYVQLKWSLCLVQLRKQNTAIKEGFQSVIDYWPNSSMGGLDDSESVTGHPQVGVQTDPAPTAVHPLPGLTVMGHSFQQWEAYYADTSLNAWAR